MAEMARHLGKQLCEAWGLDPNKVKRIVISLDASDIAIAEVSILTDGEMTEELLRLRPIDSERSDGPGSPQWEAECKEFGCHDNDQQHSSSPPEEGQCRS